MTNEENVHTIMVKSNANISKTVTQALNILSPRTIAESPNAKIAEILELAADAKAAGKAITIAEIVKRRIKEHGGKIVQTTRVQEKPLDGEPGADGQQPKQHLQGEGYDKPRHRPIAQIMIRLQTGADSDEV